MKRGRIPKIRWFTSRTVASDSGLIFAMPDVFRFAPWIEIEAKHKELAIGKLQTEWLQNSGQ